MATQKKRSAQKSAPAGVDQAPVFTKEQLVNSKTLGLPRDAVAAILKDGEVYTKDQAVGLVRDYLERKV